MKIQKKIVLLIILLFFSFCAEKKENKNSKLVNDWLLYYPHDKTGNFDNYGNITLLSDGKLLLTGNGNIAANSEIFDPATNIFSTGATLKQGRIRCTATLLNNGKVLITGGVPSSGGIRQVFSSAELYDPSTNSFATIGNMITGRYGHNAILLSDGKVLISGGTMYDGKWYNLNTTEIFDPATNSFISGGNLVTSRSFQHKSLLLNNGKVFIEGGDEQGQSASSEIYDPSSNTSSAGIMNSLWYVGEETITLLPSGKVFIAGGIITELYDSTSNSYLYSGEMNQTRMNHSATLLQSGKVLITGGATASSDKSKTVYLSSAEIYDPSTGVNTKISDMNAGKAYGNSLLLKNGKVFIYSGFSEVGIGSEGKQTFYESVEIYDPTTNTFTFVK